MADLSNDACVNTGNFKEAVCIDAGRVYDSCCARDCLEDLRCYFTAAVQEQVNTAVNIKVRSAEVLNVAIGIEPVSFNKGFYSCDLTFYFLVNFDLYPAPHTCPTQISGICCFNKKAILYGSDGNVKIFSGVLDDTGENCDLTVMGGSNTPRCSVQCVDPIVLGGCLGVIRKGCGCTNCIPNAVSDYLGAPVVTDGADGTPTVYVSLGLFSIVQLIRNVQMLIPVYDFCIPEKQCDDNTDGPCDVFRRIKFPTNDFFPPRPCDIDNDCSCRKCSCDE